MQGKLIVVDGLDGAGKTGAIAKVSEYFTNAKVPHIVTREPGGTELANFIRMGLRHGFKDVTDEPAIMAEALLFAAARADHVDKVIRPAMADGKIVLCDRFFDTTLAYQGGGRGIDPGVLAGIHHLAIGLYPDHTFIIDGPPEVFLKRMECEERDEVNKFDQLGLSFYTRARAVYLDQAALHPEVYSVINGDCSRDQVFAQFLPELMRIQGLMSKRPVV